MSTTHLELTEGGSDGTFTVSLSARPLEPVTISLASNNSAVAGVAPATITIAPATYSAPVLVTVSAVDNTLLDGTRNTKITLTATSDDPDFAGKRAEVEVVVTSEDLVSGGAA